MHNEAKLGKNSHLNLSLTKGFHKIFPKILTLEVHNARFENISRNRRTTKKYFKNDFSFINFLPHCVLLSSAKKVEKGEKKIQVQQDFALSDSLFHRFGKQTTYFCRGFRISCYTQFFLKRLRNLFFKKCH